MLIDRGYPLPNYRFAVVILTGFAPNPVDLEFKEVTGLKLSRNIVKNGGFIGLDGENQQQTLTLKRGVFTAPSLLEEGNVTESLFWQTRLLRKDLIISVMDEQYAPINAWLIGNAYLESWEWDGLNAENNGLLIESMSFKYDQIIYKTLKPYAPKIASAASSVAATMIGGGV